MVASIARVLIDSALPQLDRLFDYGIPAPMTASAIPGVRVRVPLRTAGRIADGVIVEIIENGSYSGVLSDLDSVVSEMPVLAPEVYRLARKAADRAAGSANDIVRLAVPGRQVRVEKAFLATAAAVQPLVSASPIASYGNGVLESAIAGNERLALEAVPRPVRLGGDGGEHHGKWVGGWAVTMAGAAAYTVANGRSAILAVPDYRDQEQLEAALRAVLPDETIVRLDATQSNPARYANFLRCLGDTPLVIVGNRSVIYAPASNLGLIALWDDGDPLYVEPLSPYVHARDAALIRQEQQDAALIFLGHSRSTEVERLVELGWLKSLSPLARVLPKVIPTAQQAGGGRLENARIPSFAWRTARKALETGPVLVQVGRPGYSPVLSCGDCTQSARCSRCEGPLARGSTSSIPSCQWCGAFSVNWHCVGCGGARVRSTVMGSERTAEDLGRAFPRVRVIVSDGKHRVASVDAAPALVIATRGAEPVAAAGYHAVLLLDGERMTARESLRVGEDCLRWWSNAIALAAEGASTVLVGVGGALATALVTWNQAEYARGELIDRKRLRFPPAVRVATISGPTDTVSAAVVSLSGSTGLSIPTDDVLGPVETGQGVRTILRFDYANGLDVATALRAELIRSASSRRRPPAGKGGRGVMPAGLRIRMDDLEPFLAD